MLGERDINYLEYALWSSGNATLDEMDRWSLRQLLRAHHMLRLKQACDKQARKEASK